MLAAVALALLQTRERVAQAAGGTLALLTQAQAALRELQILVAAAVGMATAQQAALVALA
jgi:hypothetical protein